ncbi:helix-turn-helix domain-containing protein [Nitrospira tepida]|uniref:helix-turn-helix domain-containing protein n=1 Tax=Nitrospira tepida TaxID=2973512 RepID=UPI00351DF84A
MRCSWWRKIYSQAGTVYSVSARLGKTQDGPLLKGSLLLALQEIIKGRGWKQVEAAAQLGLDQAEVSKLLASRMAGLFIERLVHFLSLLGQDVEVTVRKAPRGRQRGRVLTRHARKMSRVAG